MQTDGRVALYPAETTDTPENLYWSRGSQNQGSNITFNPDSNGVIFLANSSAYYIQNLTESLNPRSETTTMAIIYRMTFDFEGVFRLYSHHFERNGSSTMSEEWPKTSRK